MQFKRRMTWWMHIGDLVFGREKLYSTNLATKLVVHVDEEIQPFWRKMYLKEINARRKRTPK